MSTREDLKAYLDQELSPARAEEVRRAIESDPALQQEVRFMKLLSNEIKENAVAPEVQGAEETLNAIKGGATRKAASLGAIAALRTNADKPGAGKGAAKKSRLWTLCLGGGLAAAFCVAIALPIFMQPKAASKGDEATPGVQVMTGSPADTTASRMKSVVKMGGGGGGTAGAGFDTSTPATDYSSGTAGGVAATPAHESAGLSGGKAPSSSGTDDRTVSDSSAKVLHGARDTNAMSALSSGHKVIQNAHLEETVKNATDSMNEAMQITTNSGGYVQNSSLDRDSGESRTASLTLRVPVAQFSSVMHQLRNLGKVTGDHVTGQDVTVQIADDTARIEVLRSEEGSYMELLRNTHNITDILKLKDRLSDVRQEIATIQTEASTMKNQSALSTVDLTLTEKANVKPPQAPTMGSTATDDWAEKTWASAFSGMAVIGRIFMQLLIFLCVYSPVWVPVSLALWYFNRRKIA